MGIVTQTAVATDAETAADFGTQLQYSPTTVPDPLTASPASGTVELGDLVIVGSRIHPDPIETNEIAVHIPIGSEAWQLVLDFTGLQTSINLTGWNATVDQANERILFKPNTGHATITPEQGITLQLNKLRINRQVGTAPVVIALKWRSPGSTSWRTEEQTLPLGKFPAGFYLRNLKAESAYIENGDPVKLTWERSGGATYHLLYENIEIDVTHYSTYTVQDIRRNTMFYLRGRVQQGTGTAERTINTYVTVNKPDLTVNDLVVEGDLTARLFGPAVRGSVNGGVSTKEYLPKSDGIFILTNTSGRQIHVRLYRAGQSAPEYDEPHENGAEVSHRVTKGGRIWLSTMQSSQIRFSYIFLPLGDQSSSPLGGS
ncbi:hypothetical protein ABZ915_29060 [Streptomyces sp. NPDC046915]|uniref:hypothetical protein n=1 Tax=Streptomyces sp. NPDC046915 TaxID=3155257 RepID=UPI0033DAEC01